MRIIKASKQEYDTESIKKVIYDKAVETLKYPSLDYDEDFIKHYLRVDVDEVSSDGYSGIRIEVGAELGYEEMVYLADELDKEVRKFDPDAYFEQEEPGIMTCYIWEEDINSATNTCNISTDVSGAVKSENESASDYFDDNTLLQFADNIIYEANNKVVDPDIDILLEDVYIVDYNRLVVDFIDSVHDYDIQSVSTMIDMDEIHDESDLEKNYSWLADEIAKIYEEK